MKRAFEAVDLDHNGTLEKHELKAMLCATYGDMDDEEVDEIL